MAIWVVTIKVQQAKTHDPKNKQTSSCISASLCTDSTGAHHSFITEAETPDEILLVLESKDVHVTRVELAKIVPVEIFLSN